MLKNEINILLNEKYSELSKKGVEMNSTLSWILRAFYKAFEAFAKADGGGVISILLASAYIFISTMTAGDQYGIGMGTYLFLVFKSVLFITFFISLENFFLSKNETIKKNLFQSNEDYKKQEKIRIDKLKNLISNIYINDFIQNSNLFHDKEISRHSQEIMKCVEDGKVYKPTGIFTKDGRFDAYYYGSVNNKKDYLDLLKDFDFYNKKGISENDLKKSFEYYSYYQKNLSKLLKMLQYNINVRDDEMEEAYDIVSLSNKIAATIDRDVTALEKKKNEFYKKSNNGIGVLGDKIKIRI